MSLSQPPDEIGTLIIGYLGLGLVVAWLLFRTWRRRNG